jgi:hypothetical protein
MRKSIHDPIGGDPGKKVRSGIVANSIAPIQLMNDGSTLRLPRNAVMATKSTRVGITIISPSSTTPNASVLPERVAVMSTTGMSISPPVAVCTAPPDVDVSTNAWKFQPGTPPSM